MKKFVYIFSTAFVVFASCSVEPLEPQMLQETGERQVTIRAAFEGLDSETKTTYTENLDAMKAVMSWTAGDKISVLYQDGGYKKKELTTTLGDGVFSGTVSGTEGGKYAHWAIYPSDICPSGCLYDHTDPNREATTIVLPSEINGSGVDAIPMCVHTLNNSFDGTYRFKHMGSVLRFKFTEIPSNARQLVITSASHELAGKYYTSYDSTNDLIKYTSGTSDDGNQKTVTFNFIPNEDGTYTFFLPFGVNSPSGNFTFTFKNQSGNDICTRTTTLGALAGITLARNVMYRVSMSALTFDNYPGVSSLIISPTDIPETANNSFTISGLSFYAYEAFRENGTTIKLTGDGSVNGKIYNTSSLGRIIQIVVEKAESTQGYDGTYYTLYTGTSSNPTTTTVAYSSYVYNDYAVYNLTGGNYSYFSFMNNKAWGVRFGKMTIKYLKPSE